MSRPSGKSPINGPRPRVYRHLVRRHSRRGDSLSALLIVGTVVGCAGYVYMRSRTDKGLPALVVPSLIALFLSAIGFVLPWPELDREDYVAVEELLSPQLLAVSWYVLALQWYIHLQKWMIGKVAGVPLVTVASVGAIVFTSAELWLLVYRIQKRPHFSRTNAPCTVCYYIASLCIVSTCFANIYHQAQQASPAMLDIIEPLDSYGGIASPQHFREEVLGFVVPPGNAMCTLDQSLDAASPYEKRDVVVDVSVLCLLAQLEMDRLRGSIDGNLREQSLSKWIDIDTRGISYAYDHSSCEDATSRKAMIHLQLERNSFSVNSRDYWDAFFMSALTMVSMGLSDTSPVRVDLKGFVILEDLVGILYFVVLLGSITTLSSGVSRSTRDKAS